MPFMESASKFRYSNKATEIFMTLPFLLSIFFRMENSGRFFTYACFFFLDLQLTIQEVLLQLQWNDFTGSI